jgi:hypothetical protein
MWKAKYHQAMADRGKEVRDAQEAPYEEDTPSSKQNFKKDSPGVLREVRRALPVLEDARRRGAGDRVRGRAGRGDGARRLHGLRQAV